MEDLQKGLIEGRNIIINYGNVEIFKECTKIVSYCRPKTKHKIKYHIKRDPKQKIIRECFDLDHWKGTLKPNEDFRLPITYKPTIPNLKNVEIFESVDSDMEIIKITVKGRSLGPHCTISTKKITFYKTSDQKILEHKVEIINDSLASAHFKIDVADEDIFHITPTEGIIEPGSYEHINVKFSPSKNGLFFRKIFCQVWNCEPLIFDILAYCGDTFHNIETGLKYYNFPIEQSRGFGAYLNDSLIRRNNVPPFSLSTNNLDFGSVLSKATCPRSEVISLTNHTKRNMLVEWEKGTGIFKINPKKIKIPPNDTVQFETEFNPNDNFNVYSEKLIAQIYWKNERTSVYEEHRRTVPMFCSLRVQGHSFPENEGWITHVEVLPEVVYWQPCLPGQSATTTFLLRNRSHLPVMYKLVPPKKTNVTAKPMMGKFRNFEIIAVQLQTEENKIKTYLEEWKILINGRKEKQISIYFHGETSVPSIEIGQNNKINCGNIQEGSQKFMTVEMKNSSFFNIRYKLKVKDPNRISMDPLEDVIEGNEVKKIDIKIRGHQCAPKTEQVVCMMNIIESNGAISGEDYESIVEIIGECSYSELCACPSEKNFGNISFGKKVYVEFQAVNFGDSQVFFHACQCGDNVHDQNFRIKPCFGVINPQDSKRFVVTGIISLIGQQTLQFGYYNRVASNSPMVTGNPVILLSLNYCSEFPVIQIEEIVENNFGPLFGKHHLYHDYLRISRFNSILGGIVNDQTEQIHLRLPEFEVQPKTFTIILALNNISSYETSISLKRKQTCDCKLVEKTDTSFTTRKRDFDCPHRESLTMELQDSKFYAGTTRFLTINLKYIIQEKSEVCYVMQLSNRRVVEIYFKIFAIPLNQTRLSYYTDTFEMNLQSIYLGTRIAPVQTFWMYNNTSKLLSYEFDTTEIKHLCHIEGFEVMEMLNPIDQILPYSSKALLIKFQPIKLKPYSVEVDAKYQSPREQARTLKFKIEGCGHVGIRRDSLKGNFSCVGKYCVNSPVSLSIDCLARRVLPVWNKRKEIIFIKNNHKDHIIQYIWETVKIDDVIEVSAEREYSILHPKEVQPIVIVIKSFSKPIITTLVLPCEVINYTELLSHQLTKAKYEEVENKIEEIALNDNEKPKNPIKINPKPATFHIGLVISITTIDSIDLDINMDPKIQLQQFPNQSLENIPKSLLKKYYPEKYKVLSYPEKKTVIPLDNKKSSIFCKILEEAIANVLYSDKFKEYLRISCENAPCYYTEFIMDNQEIISKKKFETPLSNEDIVQHRKKEIEFFFSSPKLTELSNILQKLIYDSILKITQCYSPDLNIKEINEQIESTLYNCKGKICVCIKKE